MSLNSPVACDSPDLSGGIAVVPDLKADLCRRPEGTPRGTPRLIVHFVRLPSNSGHLMTMGHRLIKEDVNHYVYKEKVHPFSTGRKPPDWSSILTGQPRQSPAN